VRPAPGLRNWTNDEDGMYEESWTICTISSTPTWGSVSAYYAPGGEGHEIKASQWLWMEAWIVRKAGKGV
jgi:hypothetical protein